MTSFDELIADRCSHTRHTRIQKLRHHIYKICWLECLHALAMLSHLWSSKLEPTQGTTLFETSSPEMRLLAVQHAQLWYKVWHHSPGRQVGSTSTRNFLSSMPRVPIMQEKADLLQVSKYLSNLLNKRLISSLKLPAKPHLLSTLVFSKKDSLWRIFGYFPGGNLEPEVSTSVTCSITNLWSLHIFIRWLFASFLPYRIAGKLNVNVSYIPISKLHLVVVGRGQRIWFFFGLGFWIRLALIKMCSRFACMVCNHQTVYSPSSWLMTISYQSSSTPRIPIWCSSWSSTALTHSQGKYYERG